MKTTMNVMAIGDVVGAGGVAALSARLRALKEKYEIDFTVVNGENAAGLGLTPRNAEEMICAGADVITLGNHAFSRREVHNYLDDSDTILRPCNYADAAPGRGFSVFDAGIAEVFVVSLIGRRDMDYGPDNPFVVIEKLIGRHRITLVDFHASATSEKLAMGYTLDGRVSAVWGTHTHVQTSDAAVLPNGTGYVTDIGMTGPAQSVIGMDIEQSCRMFRGIPKDSYKAASGQCKIEGAVFNIDLETGLCLSASTVREPARESG